MGGTGAEQGENMSKNKVRTMIGQSRMGRIGRVGARLLLSLVLTGAAVAFKASLAQAAVAVPAADLHGTGVTANVPASSGEFRR